MCNDDDEETQYVGEYETRFTVRFNIKVNEACIKTYSTSRLKFSPSPI